MNLKAGWNVSKIRADFPILSEIINGVPLVYLDNAATTQKPISVMTAIADYYSHDNANVHRGIHALSDRATHVFEAARRGVAEFLGIEDANEIVWTRGTTEAINLVAATWGRDNISAGDRILVPIFEHHANIVPWQMLAKDVGAEVVPIPITSEGDLDLAALAELLDERVKLLAINHVSNALGTVNPLEVIIPMAKKMGACVLVDGAQAVPHFEINVKNLGCDFYAFSAHKMFGPTGMGALWGKRVLLENMRPYQGGGEMIAKVCFSGTTYAGLPHKFEAGTPHIAGAVGLLAAVSYLSKLDRNQAAQHENALLDRCIAYGEDMGLIRLAKPNQCAPVYSFNFSGVHPGDVGTLLDQQGVAVRSGHHCTQPLMNYLGVSGSVRASFAFYNTFEEIDFLFSALQKAKKFF